MDGVSITVNPGQYTGQPHTPQHLGTLSRFYLAITIPNPQTPIQRMIRKLATANPINSNPTFLLNLYCLQ